MRQISGMGRFCVMPDTAGEIIKIETTNQPGLVKITCQHGEYVARENEVKRIESAYREMD
jgi:hypothetical protein